MTARPTTPAQLAAALRMLADQLDAMPDRDTPSPDRPYGVEVTIMSDVPQTRGRYNALKRHRGADDPVTIAARTELRAAAATDYIRRLVSEAPPLSTIQRARLAALLLAGSTWLEHIRPCPRCWPEPAEGGA